MALCAALCSLKPDYDNESKESPNCVQTTCQLNQQLNLDLAFADQADVSLDQIDVIVTGPNNQRVSNKQLLLQKCQTEKGVVLSLLPNEGVGQYTVSFG